MVRWYPERPDRTPPRHMTHVMGRRSLGILVVTPGCDQARCDPGPMRFRPDAIQGGSQMRLDHPRTTVFAGTPITPVELLDLAEFATPGRFPTAAQRRHEAENLAEWCDDDPQLAQYAALLARGRGARPEVVDVLDDLAQHVSPPHSRLAATA
jgi:hypothetical protein